MRVPRDVVRDIIASPIKGSTPRSELTIYLVALAVTVGITDFYHPLFYHKLDSGAERGNALHGLA